MMESLNLFNEEITTMVDRGNNRPAIDHAREHAAHALTAAAGIYQERLADSDNALKLMRLAVLIQPKNPVLYSNLVCMLCQRGFYDEAKIYSNIGVGLPDAAADMFYNHGIVCKSFGLLEEAADAFRKSRDLNPNSAITHCQLANVLLPMGQYEEGLREDEWRFKALPGLKAIRKRYNKPDWDGKNDLHGKTILVFNEQGHGDAIQFSRYIPRLKELGARVILETQPELHLLYVKAHYVDHLAVYEKKTKQTSWSIADVADTPEYDCVVSIGSLPCYFDPKLDNIPQSVPYIWPCMSNTTEMEAVIDQEKDKFKVGVVWAGSFYHTNDNCRSCFFRHFGPIADIPNVTMFSLQQGNMVRSWPKEKLKNGSRRVPMASTLSQSDEDIDIDVVNLLEGCENIRRVDLAGCLKNFNDTALALQKLDLLICVDTSVAHLAGALGLNVWLLLPHAHEWRWKKEWYPTMRVFRQPNPGDWQGLLENVAKELQKYIGSSSNKVRRCGSDQ